MRQQKTVWNRGGSSRPQGLLAASRSRMKTALKLCHLSEANKRPSTLLALRERQPQPEPISDGSPWGEMI